MPHYAALPQTAKHPQRAAVPLVSFRLNCTHSARRGTLPWKWPTAREPADLTVEAEDTGDRRKLQRPEIQGAAGATPQGLQNPSQLICRLSPYITGGL